MNIYFESQCEECGKGEYTHFPYCSKYVAPTPSEGAVVLCCPHCGNTEGKHFASCDQPFLYPNNQAEGAVERKEEVSPTTKQIIDFIGTAKFDEHGGGYVWGSNNGGLQMIAEIRGWGAIQNMFKTEKEAASFQDAMGQFIVDAINEKISRSTN